MRYAIEVYDNRVTNKMTVIEIEEITKISRATLYRAVREKGKVLNE